MLIPSIFAENLFDDWFDFPSVRNMDRQLYGRHFAREMKTDVNELPPRVRSFLTICVPFLRTPAQKKCVPCGVRKKIR